MGHGGPTEISYHGKGHLGRMKTGEDNNRNGVAETDDQRAISRCRSTGTVSSAGAVFLLNLLDLQQPNGFNLQRPGTNSMWFRNNDIIGVVAGG